MYAGRSGQPEALQGTIPPRKRLIGSVSALQGGLVGLSCSQIHQLRFHSALLVCGSTLHTSTDRDRLTGLTGGV